MTTQKQQVFVMPAWNDWNDDSWEEHDALRWDAYQKERRRIYFKTTVITLLIFGVILIATLTFFTT